MLIKRSMVLLSTTFFLAKGSRSLQVSPTFGFLLKPTPNYHSITKTTPSYHRHHHSITKSTTLYHHSITKTTTRYHYHHHHSIPKTTPSYHHYTPLYQSKTSTSLQAKNPEILAEPTLPNSKPKTKTKLNRSTPSTFTDECEIDSQPRQKFLRIGGKGDESSCVPLYSHMDINLDETYRKDISNSKSVAQAQLLLAVVIPMLAYMTYDDVAKVFALFIDYLNSSQNWTPVDGGSYQAQIITPAINGIIVPSVSILFATLISNTINTLRQRQLDIRTTLNMEAGDLRILASLLDAFPTSTGKDACVNYLTQYSTRLIAECQAEVQISSLDSRGSNDSEMNGFLTKLNQLVVGNENVPPNVILSESYSCISRLNSERSSRITAVQTTFPWLHYTILFTLAGSIALTFLIESNQELLYFLNALQLHMLWTVLIGTFSALGIVCYDLNDPFHGSYQILNAVDQLFTIRDSLKVSAYKSSDKQYGNN